MTGGPETVVIAFDATVMRPGCVMVQAALGGSISAAMQFEPETWLLAPTPDMRLYRIEWPELKKLAAAVNSGECYE